MLKQNDSMNTQDERELMITRVFNAPREMVFKAWTEPAHIEQWSAPEGFSMRVTEHDFRPGGQWRYIMIGPDGVEYPSKGVFQEIVPPERIVTTDEFGEGFEDVDLPQAMVVTTLFEALDAQTTRITIWVLHDSVSDRQKHEQMGVVDGWNSCLNRLETLLASR
ncbi:SRPBCC domain-containing protein [Thermoleptolyngbya sp.]